MIDHYRRQIQQFSSNIAKLQKHKGDLAKRGADLQRRITSASSTSRSTKSPATLRAKQHQIANLSRQAADNEGRIAEIDSKLAIEQRRLTDAQKSLAVEEERLNRRRQREMEQEARKSKQQIATIDNRLTLHDSLHASTIAEIEKLKSLPEMVTVLFLASNPVDQAQLRLDEEARAIQDMIRKSEHRDAVRLESRWAMRPLDLLQSINECKPAIVHFSGHGSVHAELVLQDEEGETKLVTQEAIVQAIKTCFSGIQLVFFNTCYSRTQAEAVVEHVPAAVGMKDSIDDIAARVFAAQFYSAIGFGKPVQEAFEQARAALMLEDIPAEGIPELFVADGICADSLVIVRPPGLAAPALF